MDEVLLAASSLTLLLTGVGGAALVVASGIRRRIGRGWIPAAVIVVMLLFFTLPGISGAPFWAQMLLLLPWFVGFPLLAATFPDGRFVPRWSIWGVVISALVIGANAAVHDEWRHSPWWVLFAIGQLSVIGFTVYRYRRSATTAERESVRWVILGLVVTASAFAMIALSQGAMGAASPLSLAAQNLAGIPLMLGLVMGTAWPRALNVDAAFRAVLVATFAGFALFGVYAATVTITASTGGAPRWGAAAVAVFAYPVVRAAMRAATWLVYRDRLDPETAVAGLVAALDADDPRPTAQRVVDNAAEATGSPGVRLVAASRADAGVFDASSAPGHPGLDGPDRTSLSPEFTVAESADAAGAVSFPVTFHGELLATLIAEPRHGESELSARDRRVMSALAQHAAPALHGARALREATHAQSSLVAARETERQRLRRELHDDIGPALSGVALGAAALAKRAEGMDAGIASEARELQGDIADVVSRTREISHGLRPTVLDDQGLEAAIRARIGGASDVILTIEELGELPVAVDLAALRIVQEAVNNVRRHARATVCRVGATRDARGLRIEVSDDGVGMPHPVAAGVGLRSIRERASELGGRARISKAPEGGTIVSVWLPVTAEEGTA